jgi:hypothetical protein
MNGYNELVGFTKEFSTGLTLYNPMGLAAEMVISLDINGI